MNHSAVFALEFFGILIGYVIAPVLLGFYRTTRVSLFSVLAVLMICPLLVVIAIDEDRDFFWNYGAAFGGAYLFFIFGSFLKNVWSLGPLQWVRAKRPEQLLMIGILSVCFVFGFILAPSKKSPKTSGSVAQASTMPKADALTEEQRKTVTNAVSLSKAQYIKGDYESCLKNLKAVLEIAPNDDVAKELLGFCHEANVVQAQLERLQEREVANSKNDSE